MKVTIPVKHDNYNTGTPQGLSIEQRRGDVSLTMSGEYGDRTIEVNADQLRKSLAVLNDNTPYKPN